MSQAAVDHPEGVPAVGRSRLIPGSRLAHCNWVVCALSAVRHVGSGSLRPAGLARNQHALVLPSDSERHIKQLPKTRS